MSNHNYPVEHLTSHLKLNTAKIKQKSFHLFPSLQLRSAISYTKIFSLPSIPAPISFQEVMYFYKGEDSDYKNKHSMPSHGKCFNRSHLSQHHSNTPSEIRLPCLSQPILYTSLSYIWFARACVCVCVLFPILHIETGSFDFTQRLLIQLVWPLPTESALQPNRSL